MQTEYRPGTLREKLMGTGPRVCANLIRRCDTSSSERPYETIAGQRSLNNLRVD